MGIGERLAAIPSLIPSTARTGPYWTDWVVRIRTVSYGLDGCWCLAKVEVAGSNPVIRSTYMQVTAFLGLLPVVVFGSKTGVRDGMAWSGVVFGAFLGGRWDGCDI